MKTYPVIVTDTRQHVLWIEAASPDEAVALVKSWEDSDLRDEFDEDNFVSDDLSVEKPAPGELRAHGNADGGRQDAHVRAWQSRRFALKREAEKAACAEAGHPGQVARRNGSLYCLACFINLPAVPEAIPAVSS